MASASRRAPNQEQAKLLADLASRGFYVIRPAPAAWETKPYPTAGAATDPLPEPDRKTPAR